jgi:aryl-alcohol dehydrogenase-like predicted oxidoreductase
VLFKKVGNSGLKVSAVGLGTSTFGRKTDQQASGRLLLEALDLGINFIDTSDDYDEGRSELYIGHTLKGKRHETIIASKFGSIRSTGPNILGGSRRHIMQAVEGSLRRLQTDYIDLYQMHDPDPQTPAEETLRALNDLIRSGKVLYIGCCDHSVEQLAASEASSQAHNLVSFVTLQTRYNLLDRSIEKELGGYCQSHGIGIIPWGPMAGGFLTGKYNSPTVNISDSLQTASGRLRKAVYGDLINGRNWQTVSRLSEYALSHGHTVSELALAWLHSRPWVSVVCASATSPEQLAMNVRAANWALTVPEIVEIEGLAPIV